VPNFGDEPLLLARIPLVAMLVTLNFMLIVRLRECSASNNNESC